MWGKLWQNNEFPYDIEFQKKVLNFNIIVFALIWHKYMFLHTYGTFLKKWVFPFF